MMTSDEMERARRASFNRRAFILFGAQVGVAGAIGARLHQLQVVETEAYATRAERNRVKTEPLAPPRGEIFDRTGLPLAVNRHNYGVWIVRERAEDIETTMARLERIIALSDREKRRLEKAFRTEPAFRPVPVKDNLDWADFAQIEANAPGLAGVEPRVTWTRHYPERDALAHVIGYVAALTKEERARDRTNNPLLRVEGLMVGKNGVERSAERRLRGAAGVRKTERMAGGREVREIARDEGRRGENLTMSIDLGLQRYAMDRLTGESAAAVVMDVITGDLLAIASAPAYDPNLFVTGISHADWNALRENELDPLRNKALAGAYPPGSTYKMLTGLAALEHEVITPQTRIFCSGKIRVGNLTFHCWKRGGHGSMNFKTGLKHSCDVYYYELAQRVGIDRLAALSRNFGVGVKPELELPNLAAGNMPTKDWMFAMRGRRWSRGDTVNVGIGQGALLMSPLQLAVMTARLANGKHQLPTRIVRGVNGEPEPVIEGASLGVSERNLRLVQEAMSAVSNEAGGTAFRSRIVDPDMLVAGKTGTAQVRRIRTAERESGVRKNEELPWRLRDHALFVAYAPVAAPRYAISVVVEHGGSGSKSAAPIARDILIRALYGPTPPLESYPANVRAQIEAAWAAADRAQAAGETTDGAFMWGVDGAGEPAAPSDFG